MKKTLIITVIVGSLFAAAAFLLRCFMSLYTFGDMLENMSLFKAQQILYLISMIIVSTSAVLLWCILWYILVLKEKYKNNAEKAIVHTGITLVTCSSFLVYCICVFSFAFDYTYNTQENQIKALEIHDFKYNLEHNYSDSEYIYFSNETSFEWDTLYILSSDFNQNEISAYVDQKQSEEFQKAFKLINKINVPLGENILCFFKDDELIITMDIGLNIHNADSNDEFIYFNELSVDEAYFYKQNSKKDIILKLSDSPTE
ncbi:MAG: hypothetical protein AB1Z23_13110 [Eubacteriales bacterium]